MEKADRRTVAVSRERLSQLVRERRLVPGRYRLDATGAVSHYIGETEKDLGGTIFSVDPHGAVLLFDEADALLGKRSEVKDAHDRYADIDADPPKTR